MDSSAQILVIVLSVFLAIFLLLGIVFLVILLRVVRQIRHVTQIAEQTAEQFSNVSGAVGRAGMTTFVARRLWRMLQKRRARHGKDRDNEQAD